MNYCKEFIMLEKQHEEVKIKIRTKLISKLLER